MLALVWPCAGLLKDHPCAASGSFLGGGSVNIFMCGGVNVVWRAGRHEIVRVCHNRPCGNNGE